jgi:uncharacterized protein YyaL (SSP411 family)
MAEFACKVWGVTKQGNFEGHNILFRALSDADEAKSHGMSLETFQEVLAPLKRELYAARSKRVWPGRDEKILTAWNGLMIAAFAQAGATFEDESYTQTAADAADFILNTMRTPGGRLYRTAGVGQPPKLNGYLEDYAFLADALVTLYEATFDPKALTSAIELAEVMLKHFADPKGPGFFFTADDHEQLIARTKDLHDGSTPSGNAMAVTALLRLAALTGRRDLDARRARLLPRTGSADRDRRPGIRQGNEAGDRGRSPRVPAEPRDRVPRSGDRRTARGTEGAVRGQRSRRRRGHGLRVRELHVPGAARGRGGDRTSFCVTTRKSCRSDSSCGPRVTDL